MPQSVRLLHVEDSVLDRNLVRHALEIEHGGFLVTAVASRADFEQALQHGNFDVVLTDFTILGFEGLQVVEAVHAHHPTIPVVVLTGTGSEEIAVQSLHSGAADYVIKTPQNIQRLPHTILAVLKLEHLRQEHVQATEELRRAAQKYQSIFDNVNEGVFQTTPEGHYLSANPALARIYGYSSPEALISDLNARDLYCDPFRRALFIAELKQKGHIQNFESEVRRCDGTTIWIRENARVAWRENGESFYEGTVEDVTERKRTQQALEKVNRELEEHVAARTHELRAANEQLQRELTERREIETRLRRAYAAAESATYAQNEFFSRISHELRTPLNAILGFGQLLELEQLSANQAESVDHIMRAGHRLLELVDVILELSQVKTGHLDYSLETVYVAPLIAECLKQMQPLADEMGVQLRHSQLDNCHVPIGTAQNGEQELRVYADARHLMQALLNLISNAIKFNQPQGSVVVSCELVQPDGTKPRSVRINVTDTGYGIAPDKIGSLFTPFTRLYNDGKPVEGVGLGLSLTKSLVEAMEGHVGIHSTPGKGSTFWIELPLADTD